MKRTVAIVIGFSFLCFFQGDAFSAVTAKILSAEGQVSVKESSASDWKLAKEGTPVNEGGEVTTAADGSCDILIGKSVVKLKPSSQAVLTSFEPVKIDLKSGKIFTLVKGLGKGSSFSVGTPTAVASARGTGWGQDEDTIEVFENDVNVENKNGDQMTLEEGEGVNLEDDGSFGDVYEVSDESSSEFSEFKSDNQDQGDGGSGDSGFDAFDSSESQNLDTSSSSDITSDAKNQAEEAINDQKQIEESLKPEPEESNYNY